MQTTDNSTARLAYIKNNLSTLTDKDIREQLDIPSYTSFSKYIHNTCTGEVAFAMQRVNGRWVDTTDIEQLRTASRKNEQQLDNLRQEAELTHVPDSATAAC